MLALINTYAAKILIAAKDGDSIRSISKKIKESYGWTYKWVSELEKIGVIKRKKQELYINKENYFYKEMNRLAKNLLKRSLILSDAYLLPNLAGLEYIFNDIDAVFIWTKGGYNIGRSKESYPIFIEVLDEDKNSWQAFFSKLNINYAFKNKRMKGIYFVIKLSRNIEKEYCEGISVLPLIKTAEWANKYKFNFQPALEMLGNLYNLRIGIKYAELP